MPVLIEVFSVYEKAPLYLISNYGRVYSLITKKYIRPYLHKSRCSYYLRANLKGKKYMVHKMVAETFLKPKSSRSIEVDHIDGNTLNPRSDNLEWVTPKQNKARFWKRNKAPKF